MFGMTIPDHKLRAVVHRESGEVLVGVSKRRWIEIDWEMLRLDRVSGRRDAAEMLLAQRNRHHTLIQDNPSSD
jgi:hypothetical protein